LNLVSVRASGCSARIIVLLDREHVFDERFNQTLELTHAETCFFNWSKSIYRYTDLARVVWFYEWLQCHKSEVERIFWFDAFDVFFQSDPFETLITPGKMTFISEGIQIRESTVNFGWISHCFGEGSALSVQNESVLCFGTIGGTTDAFLKFLNFLVENKTRWFSCNLDQPQLNYYFHTGALRKVGIEAEIQHCNGTVLSLSFCPRIRVPFQQSSTFFDMSAHENYVTAAVVHHYKHFIDITRNYQERCKCSVF
jgi:hypothetical protein